MSTLLRVLIVEDSEYDAVLVTDELRDAGYDVDYERVETREQMEGALRERQWEVIICDYRLPDFSGLEALETARLYCELCPFIIISGQISEDTAVSAVKAGASDYVLKDNLARLVPAVERELREVQIRRERKEARDQLKAERERGNEILASITDGFYALDKDWRFTYVNAAAEEILGQDWQSLKGKNLLEVFPNVSTSPAYNELRRAMAERVPVTLERHIEDRRVWYTIRAYPYADGLAVYVRDITREKRAEEEIRKREELLQAIQNSLIAQIAVTDHTGTIIAVNEVWEDVARDNGDPDLTATGVGVNYLDVCRRAMERGDDSAGEVLAGIESVIGGDSGLFEMEYPFACKDAPHWFYIRVTPFRSESGGAVVVHLDITQRVMAEQRLRESEEHYRTLFGSIDEAFCVVEMVSNDQGQPVDYRYVEVNPAFERQTGLSNAQGKTARELIPGLEDRWVRIYAKIAQSGNPMRFEGRVGGLERWYEVYAFRIGSPEARQVAVIFNDITARKLAEEGVRTARDRAQALEGIAYAGITTTDLQELLDVLVARMTEVLGAHSCTIWMLDGSGEEFVLGAHRNYPRPIGFRIPATEGVPGIVLRERRPVFTGDAMHDPLIIDSALKTEGVKSLMSLPLLTGDRVVGMIRVDELRVRQFTAEEVGLTQAMASRAAQAIENINLVDALGRSRYDLEQALERERHFSLLLQRALLPEEPAINHGYSVAVQYIPYYMSREIGGDFYDIFEAADGRAGVVIGDVSGKGLESAALAATTRSTIHALVHETSSAGEALARANSILCQRQDTFETSFVTVFLSVIDLNSGDINYASAGHPPAAICGLDDHVRFLKPSFQPPICLIPGIEYPEAKDRLAPGEALVMFTDGVVEARRHSELFDLEGIGRVLKGLGHRSAEEIAGELIAAANTWAEGHLSDDAAVVVVKRSE